MLVYRLARLLRWHHIDTERRRRSVKYKTTELNFPANWLHIPGRSGRRRRRARAGLFIGVSSARFITRPAGRDAAEQPKGPRRRVAEPGPTAELIRLRLSRPSRYQHNIAPVPTSGHQSPPPPPPPAPPRCQFIPPANAIAAAAAAAASAAADATAMPAAVHLGAEKLGKNVAYDCISIRRQSGRDASLSKSYRVPLRQMCIRLHAVHLIGSPQFLTTSSLVRSATNRYLFFGGRQL